MDNLFTDIMQSLEPTHELWMDVSKHMKHAYASKTLQQARIAELEYARNIIQRNNIKAVGSHQEQAISDIEYWVNAIDEVDAVTDMMTLSAVHQKYKESASDNKLRTTIWCVKTFQRALKDKAFTLFCGEQWKAG